MGTPVSQVLGAEKRFHAHDGYEMHAVKEGCATVSTDAGELSLSSGDLLIIPPKHLHYGVTAKEDATVASLCFFFEKSAESEKGHYEALFKTFGSLESPVKFSATDKQIVLCDQLFGALFGKSKYRDAGFKASFSLILLDVAGRLDALSPTRSAVKEKRKATTNPAVHKVMEEYVTKNFKSSPTLSELARLVHLSEKHTARIFQKEFGVPFKKYVLGVRMDLAKYLLSTTAMAVEEIAERTGYTTYNGFYRLFVSETGLSPLKYRVLNQNNTKED